METLARSFVIPDHQNQFIQENTFRNALTRRTVVAMNTSSAVVRSLMKTLLNSKINNFIMESLEFFVLEEQLFH